MSGDAHPEWRESGTAALTPVHGSSGRQHKWDVHRARLVRTPHSSTGAACRVSTFRREREYVFRTRKWHGARSVGARLWRRRFRRPKAISYRTEAPVTLSRDRRTCRARSVARRASLHAVRDRCDGCRLPGTGPCPLERRAPRRVQPATHGDRGRVPGCICSPRQSPAPPTT